MSLMTYQVARTSDCENIAYRFMLFFQWAAVFTHLNLANFLFLIYHMAVGLKYKHFSYQFITFIS